MASVGTVLWHCISSICIVSLLGVKHSCPLSICWRTVSSCRSVSVCCSLKESCWTLCLVLSSQKGCRGSWPLPPGTGSCCTHSCCRGRAGYRYRHVTVTQRACKLFTPSRHWKVKRILWVVSCLFYFMMQLLGVEMWRDRERPQAASPSMTLFEFQYSVEEPSLGHMFCPFIDL